MANEKDFQEKFLTAGTTSVDFVSPPGNISVSGDFDSGTVTQALTGDVVTVASFTVDDTAFANASRLSFSISGFVSAPNVSVKWYPVHVPY